MSQRASYFKLGLFVIIAVTLLLVGVGLLGAGALFRKTIVAESYFDESVQGLEVGSPVKLRGVRIGRVRFITFANDKYSFDLKTAEARLKAAFVVVEMEIDVGKDDPFDRLSRLEYAIREGLHVRMASAGLTGGSYLELFRSTTDTPALTFPWKPELPYIPSAPSFLGTITSAAERIALQLEAANIGHVIENFNTLVVRVTEKAEQLDVDKLEDDVIALIDGLRESNARLHAILDNPAIDTTLSDLASVMGSLRGAVGDNQADLTAFVKDLPQVTGRLRTAVGEVERLLTDEQTKRTLANLAKTSDSLPGAAEDIRLLARRLEVLLASQQDDLASIVTALRRTLDNTEAITEDAKRNPARVLFGAPPPRIEPSGGPGGGR